MAKNEDENICVVSIYASYNNTIAIVSDLAGNTISRISGGQITKHDRMKANPTIAMFIAKRVLEVLKDYKIKQIYIRMKGQTGSKGIGPGAMAIVRTINKEGLKVLGLSEITKIPRGGPKKKGGRRGRRV